MKYEADKIIEILKEFCSYYPDRSDILQFTRFIQESQEDKKYNYNEYRFIGNLGSGGKFWISKNYHKDIDKLYVTCYKEDETLERLESIRLANSALESYKQEIINDEVKGKN